jgi:hypothetical protein
MWRINLLWMHLAQTLKNIIITETFLLKIPVKYFSMLYAILKIHLLPGFYDVVISGAFRILITSAAIRIPVLHTNYFRCYTGPAPAY